MVKMFKLDGTRAGPDTAGRTCKGEGGDKVQRG